MRVYQSWPTKTYQMKYKKYYDFYQVFFNVFFIFVFLYKSREGVDPNPISLTPTLIQTNSYAPARARLRRAFWII